MRLEDKQEQLSLAALHATCALAGFGFAITGRIQDNWGWDAEADVRERLDPASPLYDFRLRFQLKATRQDLSLAKRRFSFPMDIAHYDRLRQVAGYDSPTYLVVFQMPATEEAWATCNAKHLVLRNCLRWVSLRNAPEVEGSKTTIYLPQDHVLTPDALRSLARVRSHGEWIDYSPDGKPHVDRS
jgi:hypothetical protein